MNFICDLDYILDPEDQPDLTWPNFLAGEPNPTKIGSGLATLMQRYSNPPSKYFEPHCAGATSHPIVRISWFFSDNANSKTRVEWREGRCTCNPGNCTASWTFLLFCINCVKHFHSINLVNFLYTYLYIFLFIFLCSK